MQTFWLGKMQCDEDSEEKQHRGDGQHCHAKHKMSTQSRHRQKLKRGCVLVIVSWNTRNAILAMFTFLVSFFIRFRSSAICSARSLRSTSCWKQLRMYCTQTRLATDTHRHTRTHSRAHILCVVKGQRERLQTEAAGGLR